MSHSHKYTDYKVLFWMTQAIGIISLILLCIWVFFYRGGLAWSSQPKLQFNWHVLCLPFGMTYLCSLELMTFRALRYGRKYQLKLIHAAFAVPILFLVIIGYWSILDAHNSRGKPNWYSLHSWMGIATTFFYLSQGVLGSVTFLRPSTAEGLRARYMPFHKFIGLTTFVMATVTSLLGMFETMKNIEGYKEFSGEGVMMNLCGMLFAVFTILVVFLQTHHDYRRQPLVSDQ